MTVQGRLKRYTEVIFEVRRFDDGGGLVKGNTKAKEEYVSWLSANKYTDSHSTCPSYNFNWLHSPDIVDIGVDIGKSKSNDDNHASHSSTPERFFKYLVSSSSYSSDDKQERLPAFPAQSLIFLTILALLLMIPSLSWRLSILALVCTFQYGIPWCTRVLVAQRRWLERWNAKLPARD